MLTRACQHPLLIQRGLRRPPPRPSNNSAFCNCHISLGRQTPHVIAETLKNTFCIQINTQQYLTSLLVTRVSILSYPVWNWICTRGAEYVTLQKYFPFVAAPDMKKKLRLGTANRSGWADYY